jgi:hypothetical protein
MNAHSMIPRDGDAAGMPADGGRVRLPADKLDLTLAACSRLLLGAGPSEETLQEALADLSFGFDACHVSLFQIESYHAEDNRSRWLACSSPSPCPHCQENRAWDYIRLIDDSIRGKLERGQCCHVGIDRLPPDFQREFLSREAAHLILLPLTVWGKWWGFLCIETAGPVSRGAAELDHHQEAAAAIFSVYFERRYAAERYQELNKLSGALETAGTICHKLNQPMQVILGYASMVTSGDISETAQIIEIVQLIEDETRQMGIITKNLMGITKNRAIG